MAVEITIPRLGWSMDEGIFGEWLKRDGDFVKSGEAIFTLESEKALQEIESVDEGILRIATSGPSEGDTVTVGTLIGYLVGKDEAIPASAMETVTIMPKPDAQSPPAVAKTTTTENSNLHVSSDMVIPERNETGRLPSISPRAARAARELGVSWQNLKGSGRNGRIRERDVRAATTASPPAKKPAGGAVRQVIAERMMHSVRSTAPVTLTTRADATNLVSLRQQFKVAGGDAVVPSYQDIVLKIVATALVRHPALASLWTETGIIAADRLHLGIAVDTEAGLLVPVLRDVDKLPLRELAVQSRQLIERAIGRKCSKDELSGGVFTVSNLGAFGVEYFTPIINSPESAILGLGVIRREAVVLNDDQIVPRDILSLSLTFDHRVTDGAPAARFLQDVRQGVENPSAWLIG